MRSGRGFSGLTV